MVALREVAQADRDFAADYNRMLSRVTERDADNIRCGWWDDTREVQQVVAHRLAHSEPRPVAERPKDKALRLVRDLVIELETWEPELLDVLRATPQAALMREWLGKAPEPRPVAGEDEETAYRKWWDNERNKPDAAWQGSPYRAAFAAGFRLATHSPSPTEAGTGLSFDRTCRMADAYVGEGERDEATTRAWHHYRQGLIDASDALSSTQGGAEA